MRVRTYASPATDDSEAARLEGARRVANIPPGNGRHAGSYFFHQDWAKPAARVGRRVAS